MSTLNRNDSIALPDVVTPTVMVPVSGPVLAARFAQPGQTPSTAATRRTTGRSLAFLIVS
jgi:hypothetical protein